MKLEHDPHKPRHSEPHAGHGGTKFEGVDASLKLVGWSLASIAGMLIIVFALVIGLEKYLYDTTPLGQPASPLAPGRGCRPILNCRCIPGKSCRICTLMKTGFWTATEKMQTAMYISRSTAQ